MDPTERNQRMVELYAEGATLEEIGAQFGVTRERVRQIVKMVGGVDADAARQRRTEIRADELDAARAAFLREHRAVAEALAERGLSREVAVGRIVALHPDVDPEIALESLRRAGIVFLQAPAENVFSTAELHAGLWFLVGSNEGLSPDRKAAILALPAEILEAVPTALADAVATANDIATILGVIAAAMEASASNPELTITGKRYEELRLELVEALGLISAKGQSPWPPTRQTLMKRFGGWNEALESIGLAAGAGRPKGLVVYTESEYLDAVRDYYVACGRAGVKPTFDGYGGWVTSEKEKGARRPSPASVRLQYGSWLVALQAAQQAAGALAEPTAVDAPEFLHPFVGPEWDDLVITLIGLTNGIRGGGFWRMDTLSAKFGFDATTSPYAQVVLQDDGTLQVEIRGLHSELDPSGKKLGELGLLGWEAPTAALSPNAHRLYPAGWNAATVAQDILEALTMAFELAVTDFFAFGRDSDSVRQMRTLHQIGDGIFSLTTPDAGSTPEEVEYGTVSDVLDRLVDARLLDSLGHDLDDNADRGQGLKYQTSPFTGDMIEAYYIDVSMDEDPEAHWVSLIHDRAPVVTLTGPNWVLSVTQALDESDLDEGIVSRLLDALPGFDIFTVGEFGGPKWFDMPFAKTQDVVRELEAAGFTTLPLDPADSAPCDNADPYIQESLADDTFRAVRVGRAGSPTTVVLHVLIDENRADRAAEMLGSYFPLDRPSAIVAADGWVIRVSAPERERVAATKLTVWAQAIFVGLDGSHLDYATAGETGYGPCSDAVERVFSDLEQLTRDDAARLSEPWVGVDAQERERARDRASRLMASLDRDWIDLMERTGAESHIPLWYAEARDAPEPPSTVVQLGWHALYAAQCAAVGHAVSDVPSESGGLTPRERELLTAHWATIMGGADA